MSDSNQLPAKVTRVLLFASAKARVGRDSIEVCLPERATVGDLRTAIGEQFTELSTVMPTLFVAVDEEYAADNTVIPTGAEVACFPPVSGG